MSLLLSIAIGFLSMLLAPPIGATETEDPFFYVSMIEVISQPEKFDSKNIAVVGYLPNETAWLYLTEAHAKLRDIPSGIPLSFAFSDVDILISGAAHTGCEGQMVRVFGRLILMSGIEWAIKDVNKVVVVNEHGWPVTCWEKASNKSLNPEASKAGSS